MTDNRERVYETLTDEGQTVRELGRQLNLSEPAVKRHLRWLEHEGRAVRKSGTVSMTHMSQTEDDRIQSTQGFDERRVVARTPDLWSRPKDLKRS